MSQEIKWNILQYIHSQIVMADAKAAGLVAANAIVAGAVLSNLESVEKHLTGNCYGTLLALFAGVLVLFSLIASLACVFPNSAKKRNSGWTSLIFFEHIASLPPSDYSKNLAAMEMNPSMAHDEIAQQISILAGIATNKFNHIKLSVKLAQIGILLGALTLAVTL